MRFLTRPDWAVAAERPVQNGLSSRNLLRLVEVSNEIGFWWSDPTGNQIECSIGFYGVLGLDPSLDLPVDVVERMMHPDDRARHADQTALLRSGQPTHGEFRIIRPDRTQRWVSYRTEVLVGADGRPTHFLGMVEDVTALHEARRAVEQSRGRFEALAKATAAAIWIADGAGRPIHTPLWTELTGRQPGIGEFLDWLSVLHPDDRQRTGALWTAAIRDGVPYDTTYRILCVDGVYRRFNARGVPVRDGTGTIQEWIGVWLAASAADGAGEGSSSSAPEARVTAAQLRGARGMAGLSAEEVARRAGISVSTVRRLEAGEAEVNARRDTVSAVRHVLEDAGIAFTFEPHAKPGIRPL